MKTIISLILLFCASAASFAQQARPAIQQINRCRLCARRVVKRVPSPPPPATPSFPEFFVGEARVNVTKDETVVRLAMAQHGSVFIELPANDGPRYIIPGDPEMATVDQIALERNKRAIVVRPGSLFLPPPRNGKTRTPAATVTAQMRSGLVVTFLFYPVEDLAQNVHRCVLNYNRDEVVARRRAVGLPVNLDMESRGEMAAQPAAPLSIAVENDREITTVHDRPTGPTLPTPEAKPKEEKTTKPSSKEQVNDSHAVIDSASQALKEALKKPKQFNNWTRPSHGLALSVVSPPSTDDHRLIVVAIKNTTKEPLKLTPDAPELFVEMTDDQGKPLNIESVKKLHVEPSDPSRMILPGSTFYYSVAFTRPVLGVRQRLRLALAQTNAVDEPASILLTNGK